MDKVYAVPGGATQQVGGDAAEGWIEMHGLRPTLEHIATAAGSWVLPEPPVPQVVSRWQGREAMRLTSYGDPKDGASLFDATEAILAHPETPAYYRTAWDELQQFEYGSPMLQAIADELGLSQDDLAQMFRLAATLRA